MVAWRAAGTPRDSRGAIYLTDALCPGIPLGMTGAGTCDPFAVVTRIATEAGKKPHVIGKTEVMPNTQSPTWAKTFSFDYELGSPCRLAVSVYHKS